MKPYASLFTAAKMPIFTVNNLILLSAIIGLTSCQENITSITFITPEQIKDIGDSVELNCTINNPDDHSVIWSRKDRDRPNDNVVLSIQNSLTMKDSRYALKISNDSKSYVLQINNIEQIDTAIYECQIIISTTNKETANVELLVRTPPKISDSLSIIPGSTPEGQAAQLTCIADGYPRPNVYWIREYNALLPGGGHTYSGNVLKIPTVSKVDRGTYYCIAENGVGKEDKKNINFEVEFAPVISVPRPKVAQALDYDIELECKVEAYPAPSIVWLKNDEPITNNGQFSISNTATVDEITSSILRIQTVQHHQYGDYYCKANNKVGHTESRIHLFESVISVYPWYASSRDD